MLTIIFIFVISLERRGASQAPREMALLLLEKSI